MRFAVPQFIDIEDKIVGPLTLKQAIYLAGGAGIVLALFTRFGFFWAIVLGAPFLIVAFMLAFLKLNKRPFYLVIYSGFFYFIGNKLYLWKRMPKKKKKEVEVIQEKMPVTPKLSQSRLKELAWSLDTRESMYTTKEQWK